MPVWHPWYPGGGDRPLEASLGKWILILLLGVTPSSPMGQLGHVPAQLLVLVQECGSSPGSVLGHSMCCHCQTRPPSWRESSFPPHHHLILPSPSPVLPSSILSPHPAPPSEWPYLLWQVFGHQPVHGRPHQSPYQWPASRGCFALPQSSLCQHNVCCPGSWPT